MIQNYWLAARNICHDEFLSNLLKLFCIQIKFTILMKPFNLFNSPPFSSSHISQHPPPPCTILNTQRNLICVAFPLLHTLKHPKKYHICCPPLPPCIILNTQRNPIFAAGDKCKQQQQSEYDAVRLPYHYRFLLECSKKWTLFVISLIFITCL